MLIENTTIVASEVIVDETGETPTALTNSRNGKGYVEYTGGSSIVGEEGDIVEIAAMLCVGKVRDATLQIVIGDTVLLDIDGENYKVETRRVFRHSINLISHYEYKLSLDTRGIVR